MSLVDTLNQIWTQILALTQVFVMPDWGKLVGLLPVFVLIGLIGPFITFTMLGAMVYLIRRPRVQVTFVEGPRQAEIGPGGEPDLPGRPAPLPAPRARLSIPGRPAAPWTVRQLAVDLPDVRPRPPRRDRHVLQLRPRPQGQAAGRRGPQADRAEARWRGGRLTMAGISVRPLLAGRRPRRPGLRGPRRARGHAGQRPARAARLRARCSSPPTPAS